MSNSIDRKAFSELKGYTFVIPSQQRGYKWTKDNVNKLLNDFKSFIHDDLSGNFYCMQPLAVVELANNRYKVLDGQQRLTTLYLLNKCLRGNDEHYYFEFETEKDKSRTEYLKGNIPVKNDNSINEFFITESYNAIKGWFDKHPEENAYFTNFLNASKYERSAQFIWYVVDKQDEHEVFENLNSGKLSLKNPELIKAVLMSPNSSIENKEQAIIQFEEMNRALRNDRFWYMLQNNEPGYRKSRMDLVFNLALGISDAEFESNPNKSFDIFYDNMNIVQELWKKIRQTFTLLIDLYENPYCYHYVGYLTYCKSSFALNDIIELRRKFGISDFIGKIKEEYVKGAVPHDKDHKKVSDFSYENSTPVALRKLFVLYNIETILSKYEKMKRVHNLRFSYEQFPFELLYKQGWDIEHISSQTDNDFTKPEDRKDWIDAYKADSIHSSDKDILERINRYETSKKKDDFDSLYRLAIAREDEDLQEQKVEDKHQIGNLVLLDSHTNRSFHNSLYPRKRAIVIIADGNMSPTEKIPGVKNTYIPVCTKNVFMKYYNKNARIIQGAWTKEDCSAYSADIEQKLSFYYDGK